jgi:hypothetical protein
LYHAIAGGATENAPPARGGLRSNPAGKQKRRPKAAFLLA